MEYKNIGKHKKILLFVGILAAAYVCGRLSGWSSYLGSAGNLEFMERLTGEHLGAAVAVYMVITVFGCVVLTLPGITFAVLAGLLFGPVLGTICCLAAATLGAMAAFLAGRYFLRDSIRPVVMKNKHLKKWLFDDSGKNGLFLLMVTRLVPLFPYNLQNFAYGVTDISFASYSFWSFVFMLPGTAMYTVGAAGVADRENRLLYLGIAAALAAAVTGFDLYFKKKYTSAAAEKGTVEKGNVEKSNIEKSNIEKNNVGSRSKEAPIKPSADACTHCHICRKHCIFLQKYQMDIGDVVQLRELAYHCFLCGTCTAVCPEGIDGRALVLSMRREKVEENHGACREKNTALLLAEKQNYLFRNKRQIAGKSVLFPGCNFPSFYPKTTRKLIEELRRKADMGIYFDCCGKPVAELGLLEREEQIISRIQRNFRDAGAEELVTVCPNCCDFLKSRLSIRVISIYEKLSELGIGRQMEGGGHLFLPCPDREERRWLPWFAAYFSDMPEIIEGTQCCGLGGGAAAREPQLAAEMANRAGQTQVYTYCASCAGNLSRNGCREVTHLLAEILDTGEQPDTAGSFINRVKTKFW